jgi:glycosyltransferase involved in cell wall biosynthesis
VDKICILLPAYNEGSRVSDVLRRVQAVPIENAQVEIVLVDDGSTDDTAAQARAAGARVVSLGTNLGVGAALGRGFELAREEDFDFLVHLDADGQIDPAQIPHVLEPVRRGAADAAIGSRFLDGRPGYLGPCKAAALKMLAAVVGLAVDAPLSDLSCGIRALNKAAIDAARPRFKYDYIQETLLQFFAARLRVTEIPVLAVERGGPRGISGRTVHYTVRYLLLLAFSLARFFLSRLKPPHPAPAPQALRL